MKKPDEALLKLREIGAIRGIIIDYRQTGTDSAETFCEILGADQKKISGKWGTYKVYLEVSVDWCSVARIRPDLNKQIDAWIKYEKENEAELAEYERLKKKFDHQ